MAATALVLYLAWALLAFGLRALVQRRRTGDAGLRVGTERPSSVEWWARLGFVVALLLGLAAPVAALTGILGPLPALARAGVQWTGVALAAGGVAATFVVQLAMGDSWRIGVDASERTDLVTNGPFAIVRNPIFTTMGITAIGFALMVPSVLALAGLVLLAVALELQVRVVEEPYLRARHREDYARYTRTVGRFLPGIGRDRTRPATATR